MGKSVCVVGGGVIGLCCAYYLLQEGFEVTLVERGDPGHDSCSLGNAGMIVPSHFVPLAAPGMVAYGLKMLGDKHSPFALKPRLDPELLSWGWKFWRASTSAHVERCATVLRDLNLRSRENYAALASALGDDFGLATRGLVMLCKTRHALEDEAKLAERANRLGVPAEVLDAASIGALDPDIECDVAGGVYFPMDCHLSPQRFVAALTEALQARGVRFVWSTNVTDWTCVGDRVETALAGSAQIEADEFVVAGGAWSPQIARGLDLALPMQGGKGYSVTLESPRQLPRLCSILVEARVAVTPMGERLRFGGTMEIGGLDLSVNEARVEGIRRSIPLYFPRFTSDDLRGVPVWSGLRPCSPDGMPFVGRTRRWSNVTVATGHAMMGLSLGPVTGELVAGAIAGRKSIIPAETLDPDRYL